MANFKVAYLQRRTYDHYQFNEPIGIFSQVEYAKRYVEEHYTDNIEWEEKPKDALYGVHPDSRYFVGSNEFSTYFDIVELNIGDTIGIAETFEGETRP